MLIDWTYLKQTHLCVVIAAKSLMEDLCYLGQVSMIVNLLGKNEQLEIVDLKYIKSAKKCEVWVNKKTVSHMFY